MLYNTGKNIFFEHIAEYLISRSIAFTSNTIGLRIIGNNFSSLPEDIESLASAICRSISNTPDINHFTLSNQPPTTNNAEPTTLDCAGQDTSTALETILHSNGIIILFNYRKNNSLQVPEIHFNTEEETSAIENAFLNIFQLTSKPHDNLVTPRFKSKGFRKIANDYGLFHNAKTLNCDNETDVEKYCHNISRNWVFNENKISAEDVFSWVKQFRSDGFTNEACSMLSYLHREGYKTKRSITSTIINSIDIITSDKNWTHFATTLQEPGKSESLLSYNLNPVIQIKTTSGIEKSINRKTKRINIICVDDIIVSGDTFKSNIIALINNTKGLANALESGDAKITAIAALGNQKSIDKTNKDLSIYKNIYLNCIEAIPERHRVLTPNNVVIGNSNIDQFKEFCLSIGRRIFPASPLGWNNSQWCIAFDYSIPDGSLPLLWASDKRWKSLFPRNRN